MYVTSKRSAEKMVHEENCRYAKMMAPMNKVYFNSAQDAYAKEKTACRYCAAVMRKLPAEMMDIVNICEANDMSIEFNLMDGTLEVATPMSEWKIAPVGNKNVMNLYHKNTLCFDDGTSPYTGYHFQRVKSDVIMGHLKYIIEHDWYKSQKQAKGGKKAKSGRELRYGSNMRVSRRIRHSVRMRRDEMRYSAAEVERYAAVRI